MESALSRFRDHGFDSFDLTATYHPITTFAPGFANRRVMDLDKGGVFFPARVERYGRIKPAFPEDRELLEAWPRAAEASARLGLKLTAWTVAMYQPWIAHQYPDCARVLPTGQRSHTSLCPCSSDVQDFMAIVVEDLLDMFGPAIQLEGVTQLFFNSGWRFGPGTRMLTEIDDWARRLLSLCFCPSCTGAAQQAGVAVEPLRQRILDKIRLALDPDQPKGDAETLHLAWMAEDADYRMLIKLRDDASVRLVNRIADLIDDGQYGVPLSIWGPAEYDGTRLDLDRVIDRVSMMQLRQPAMDLRAAQEGLAVKQAHPHIGLKAILWCGGAIGPKFGPGFEEALRACVALPVDQINVMNWGLLPDKYASAIVPLLRRFEAEARTA